MRRTTEGIWSRLEWVTAAGGVLVVTFWSLYFLANDTLGLVAPAHAAFEESFIVADGVLAVVLFATSRFLHRRRVEGPFFLAVAGAMALYLGILDATFYARHGLFTPVAGALTEVVVNGVCIGGGLYGLRAAWTLWRETCRIAP